MPTANISATLLTNPFVLRCAWHKISDWYSKVEWVPEPEWSEWQQDPWGHLIPLAESLADGTFVASPMRQIPYPKQGAEIRHYVLPCVRDQVAHMIFAVLLAPFIEERLANVNFGSRWFRGLQRVYPEGRSRGVWKKKPLSLSDKVLFNPYKRDYGLFRRLATWTAGAFVGSDFESAVDQDTAFPVRREDYPASMLPYISAPEFQLAPCGEKGLCYARLDLKKAYPSIHRADVRKALMRIVREDVQFGADDAYSRWGIAPDLSSNSVSFLPVGSSIAEGILENPWGALLGRKGQSIRRYLVDRWMTLLEAAVYDPGNGAFDLSDCVPGEFSEGQAQYETSFGLPTGLAVSPLLLNSTLTLLDYPILRYLDSTKTERGMTSAYLRFADDLILFSVDEQTLRGLIGELQKTLGRFKGYGPSLKPQINWKKARPQALAEWGEKGKKQEPIALEEEDYLDSDNQAEFVTFLVQRMSGLAMESLLDRSGQRASTKMTRLHELARWDIKDVEVRKDTRLSFVSNKLARAWIPSDSPEEFRQAVHEIRQTIRKGIIETPWKFGLWRGAIHTALRTDPASNVPIEDGIEWLEQLLRYIAVDGEWTDKWPRGDRPATPNRGSFATSSAFNRANADHEAWLQREKNGFRASRVSFLRAHFWRELAKTIRQLSKLQARGDGFPAFAWYARVLKPEALETTVAVLCETERWGKILYGVEGDHNLPWWEADAIKLALSACLDSSLQYGGEFSESMIAESHSRLFGLIARDIRPEQEADLLHPFIKDGQIALTRSNIYCKARLLASRQALVDAEWAAEIVREGLEQLTQSWPPAYAMRHQEHARFYRQLSFYRDLRSVMLSYASASDLLARLITIVCPGSAPSIAPSIYHVMWGVPQEGPLVNWPILPSAIPALGLPTPWALRIFHDLAPELLPDSIEDVREPVLDTAWNESFAHNRRESLRDSFMRHAEPPETPHGVSVVARWSTNLSLPPHPTMFLPGWFGWAPSRKQYWQAALNLFFTLNGNERFHDSVWEATLNQIPWSENLRLRCANLLPSYVWRLVDHAMGTMTSSVLPSTQRSELATLADHAALMHRGRTELITSIEIRKGFPVIDRSEYLEVRRTRDDLALLDSLVGEFVVPRASQLKETLTFRMAQISAEPDWKKVAHLWPAPSHVCQEMFSQVLQELEGLSARAGNRRSEIIAFPELAIHPEDADEAARYASSQGSGLLSGLFWRAIPFAVQPAGQEVDVAIPRYFVNEAILSVPNLREPDLNQPYIFRIRKPRPAHIEYGVQAALTSYSGVGGEWRVLPGKEWLRFDHPHWGAFAVAICSDLLDVGPWARLKGSILHLFLVAWNTDVELYDAMTWTRAYELFVNVVAVNHGQVGGSLAWVPKHGHRKNLFTVKGKNHFVSSDVILPVSELHKEQAAGPDRDMFESEWEAKGLLKIKAEGDVGPGSLQSGYKKRPVHYQQHGGDSWWHP